MRYAAASASNGSAKRANNSVAGLKTVEELSSKDVLTVPDLVAVLLFVLYVSLGLVYYVIAKGRFNTFDSVYFSIQTLMTIGYGDVLPPAEDLRFTTFYVILGAGLVGAFLPIFMGNVLAQQEDFTARRLLKCRSLLRKMMDEDRGQGGQLAGESKVAKIGADLKAIEAIDTSVFDEEVADLGARLLNDATMVAALTAVGACIISSIEGWSFDVAYYWAWVTALSIGYGDYAPKTDGGKVFLCFYGILGCSFVAKGFADLARYPFALRARRYEAEVTAQFSSRLSPEVLRGILKNDFFDRIPNLRQDFSHIQKCEFILMMLQMMGKASDKDILFCAKLFDRLDASGSGCLDEREMERQIEDAKRREEEHQREEVRRREELDKDGAGNLVKGFLDAGEGLFTGSLNVTSNLLSIGVSLGGGALSSMMGSPAKRPAGAGDGDVQLVDVEAVAGSPLPERRRRKRRGKKGSGGYSPTGRDGYLGDDFGDDVAVEAVTPGK